MNQSLFMECQMIHNSCTFPQRVVFHTLTVLIFQISFEPAVIVIKWLCKRNLVFENATSNTHVGLLLPMLPTAVYTK